MKEEKNNNCTPYKIPQEKKSIQSIERKENYYDNVKSAVETHTHSHIVILNWTLNWKCIKKQNFYEIVINWETENILKIWGKKLNSKFCFYSILLFSGE